jgi:hypothetical protein
LPASSVRRLEAHDEVVARGLEILTRPRRRATQFGRAAVAAALIVGGYFAATDRAVIRTCAQHGLTTLQLFVRGPAARRAVDGERLISRASQNAKAYLSMGTSP